MEQTDPHTDALSHQAAHGCLHGNIPASMVESPSGFSQHGAETIPPMVKRAVFANLAPLAPEYQFTADDLEKALGNTKLNPGDILLVRTGFDQLWHNEAAYLKAAGAHKSATLWAADHQVFAVGADNMAWDVPGVIDEETGVTLFGHFYLLPQKGIYIIENLKLEELAATGIKECLFICLPLKLNGATGSPVRPIALI